VGSLAGDLAELFRKKDDLRDRQQRLASQMDPLSASQHLPKSLSELKYALRSKEAEREKLSERCRDLKDDQVRQMKRLQDLEAGLRSVAEDCDKVEAQAKRLADLDARRAGLREGLDGLDGSRAALRRDEPPRRQAVAELEAQAARLAAAWKDEGAALRQRHAECSRMHAELRRLASVAASSAAKGTTQQLVALDDQLGAVAAQLERHAQKVGQYQKDLSAVDSQHADSASVRSGVEGALAVLMLR
jgi:chromosome segregation ATPase